MGYQKAKEKAGERDREQGRKTEMERRERETCKNVYQKGQKERASERGGRERKYRQSATREREDGIKRTMSI